MDQRVIRGVGWTLGSFGATKVVMVLSTVLLGRLLAPADFGIVAIATLVITLLGVFRDLGLGAVVIVSEDTSDRFLGTNLTLMGVSALAITLIVTAAAPLVAILFDEPRVTGVLVVLSTTAIVSAVGWFYECMLQRAYEFRLRFIAQILQVVGYAVVSLSLALAGTGVWALVLGHVAAQLIYCLAMVSLAPRRIRPHFDRGAARASVSAGSGFLVQGGAFFVRSNLDFLVIGRVLNASALGSYSMAYRFAELPYNGVGDPISKVTFPAFARMREEGGDVSSAFLSVLRLVALVTCPMALVLSGAAEPFVRTLLGDRWLPMIGPLAVLGIWGFVRTLDGTIGWFLNSVGEAKILGRVSIFVVLPLLPALAAAVQGGGTSAVAVVVLADSVLATGFVVFLAKRRAGVDLSRQWRAVKPVVLACPLTWLAARGVAEVVMPWSAPVALVAATGAGLAVYGIAVSLAEPGSLRRARGQITAVVRRHQGAAEPA